MCFGQTVRSPLLAAVTAHSENINLTMEPLVCSKEWEWRNSVSTWHKRPMPLVLPHSHSWDRGENEGPALLQAGTAWPSCARCVQPRQTCADPKEVTAALPRALNGNYVAHAGVWIHVPSCCQEFYPNSQASDHREIPCGHQHHPGYG